MTPRTPGATSSLLWGLVAVVGMLVSAYVLALDVTLASVSATWPTTIATIRSIEVDTQHGRKGNYYELDVTYDYLIDGHPHVGTLIHGGIWRKSFLGAQVRSQAEHYAVGSSHPVAYDPADPARALLEPGWSGLRGSMLTSGGLLLFSLAVSVISLVDVSRQLSNRRATPAERHADEGGPWRH